MKKLKIYLAGTVTEIDYRKTCKEKYSDRLDLKDPLVLIPEDLPSDKVVEGDLELIMFCDILVAYIRIGSTFGTSMEIAYAKKMGKSIYVINPNGLYYKDKWLEYHTTKFFRNIDDCFEHIINVDSKILNAHSLSEQKRLRVLLKNKEE